MKYGIVSLFIAAILLAGCKKETTNIVEYNPNITLYGVWKVAVNNDPDMEDLMFINFKTDKVFNTYTENKAGIRSGRTGSCLPYPDQLLADLYGWGNPVIFNYQRKNDSLFLYKGEDLMVSFAKAAESDISGWYETVSVISDIKGNFIMGQGGIGYDNEYLLLPDYSNSRIIRFDVAASKPADTLHFSGTYPNTVEFDGTDYWVASNGYSFVSKYKKNGTFLLQSSQMGAWMYGIAYEAANSNLWCYSNNEDSLYCYNTNSNTVTASYYMGYGMRDAAWANGRLYITKDNYIYRIKTSPFRVDKTYKLDIPDQIYGIAMINNQFWLNTEKRLIKVNLN